MTVPITLNAAELASYLAAIEAHPFASLLLAIILIAFFRTHGPQCLLRSHDYPHRADPEGAVTRARVKKPLAERRPSA